MKNTLSKLAEIFRSFLIKSTFDKGCYRIGDTTERTGMDGYGISVATDCVIESVTSEAGWEPPQNGDELKAGYYWGGPVSALKLSTAGLVFIGKR